jgi:hypothetical protein
MQLGLVLYELCKKYVYKNSMKPGMPVMRSTRLLAQVRERIRYLNYSLSPAKAYLYWVRFHPLNRGLGGHAASAGNLLQW